MGRPKKQQPQPLRDPTLSHGVLAIVLLVVASIITLSFFDKAGTVGTIINEWILSFLFGSMRFGTPIVLIIFAWYLVADVDYTYRPTHGIGALLFFITASSLLHLQFPPADMWLEALEGHGGGVFGMLAWVLKTYLGTAASWILLLGMLCISLLLLFNTTLARFVDYHKQLMQRLGFVGTGLKKSVNTLFVEEKNRQDETEDEENEEEVDEEVTDESEGEEKRFVHNRISRGGSREEDDAEDENESDEVEEEEETTDPLPQVTHTVALDVTPAWQRNAIIKKPPSVELLETRKEKPTSGDVDVQAKIIEETLREFKIDVAVEDIRVGPTVTQYALRPARGVKLAKITTLSNDLSLALAAHPIRIEAPIPGKSLVGIEVPNSKTAMVSLKELIVSPEFKKRKHNLMIGLGKDVGGNVWFADLPRMPHLLIAGATGSGKTVCMNTIITTLLYQNTAADLRFIMVDPKRVELTMYNGIPHLLTPVITNTQKTINALKWTIEEMDRRFEVLSQAGNRDIGTYNAANPTQKIPYLIFVIDELADLMATAANDIEAGIIRLAQMSRAVGIHLIVATQRPSVNVITGLMKANIPARIAFSVASLTDSRTILDAKGAEKLIGRGDMLFQTADLSKPMRLQGAFISEDEVKKIAEYLKGSGAPVYEESVVEKTTNKGTMNLFGGTPDDQDPLLEESKQAILDAGKASASFLQRKLKIGYARAARILDELEEAGVIGPADGAKPREILITAADINHTTDSGGSLNVFTHQPYTSGEKREPLLDAYPEGESEEEEENDEDEELEEEIENENENETDNDDAIEEETFDDEESEDEDDDAIDEEENTDVSEEKDEDDNRGETPSIRSSLI